jgi:autotransporter-associated beta strand protein
MKFPVHSFTLLTTAALVLPGSAGLIYSNLQDISIPANFDGVYLNVETGAFNNDSMAPVAGWDVNPFFGGSAIWNAPAFQPVRAGTTGTSAVLNLATGTIVDGSSVFSTAVQGTGGENVGGPAYGASETHMGAGAGQFQSGQEGYFGFRLNGTNYGWMRVEFDSTGAGTIKEWAYDNTGAQIAVGNITNTGSVVTANSSQGNFSVTSVITDALATPTSFVKSGTGTTDLNGANTYTGTTTISTGRLNVNGSTAAASTVIVDAGTTLGGDGLINGNVTLDGILRAGQGGTTDRSLTIAGTVTANTGSSMLFNIASESSYDQLIVGSVNLNNINLVIESLTDTTLNLLGYGEGGNFDTSGASFYELIDGTTTGMFANVTETMNAYELGYYGLTGTQYTMMVNDQKFWLAQGSTFLVAIPESSVTLLGSLGALLLLRRRR